MFFQKKKKKKTEVYSWYKYILKTRILKRGARTRYTESRTSTLRTSHLNHCYDFSNTKGHLGWVKLDKNKANKRKTLPWSRDMFLKFLFWVIWPGILLVRQRVLIPFTMIWFPLPSLTSLLKYHLKRGASLSHLVGNPHLPCTIPLFCHDLTYTWYTNYLLSLSSRI